MTIELRQSTSRTILFGPFLDATDGVSLETGLASAMDNGITGIRVSKNGATLVDRNSSTAPIYDAMGLYKVEVDVTDTNALGVLRLIFEEAATCLPVWQDFMVLTANAWDSKYSTDKLQVDVVELVGDVMAATSLSETLKRVVKFVDAATGDPKAVIEAANAGDLILLSPGNHAIGANSIAIPDDVEVAGFGRDLTTLTSTVFFLTPVIQPGNRTLLRDITIEASWCYGLTSAASAVDCRIENVRFGIGINTASASSVKFNSTVACSCTIRNTEIFSSLECVFVADNVVSHSVALYDVDCWLKPGASNSTNCLKSTGAGGGRIFGNNVNIIQEAGSAEGIALRVDDGSIKLTNSSILLWSTSDILFVTKTALVGTYEFVNCEFDRALIQTLGDVTLDIKDAEILTDTAEIGPAGAGLTAINLPDQVMNITGNLSGGVGFVTAEVSANITKINGDTDAADNLKAKSKRVVKFVDASTDDPKAIIEAANVGDLILLGPGVHDIGVVGIVVPNDVEIAGVGRDATTLKGGAFGVHLIQPGDRCLLRDITLEGIWIYGNANAKSSVDCRVENARIGAGPETTSGDAIRFESSAFATCTIRDTEIFCDWDAIIWSDVMLSKLALYNVNMYLKPGAGSSTTALISGTNSTSEIYGNNVNIICEAGSVQGVICASKGGKIRLVNSSFLLSGTSSELFTCRTATGGGTYEFIDCEFDRSLIETPADVTIDIKTSQNLIDPWIASLPGAYAPNSAGHIIGNQSFGTVILHTTIATVNNQTSFVLTDGDPEDDTYKKHTVFMRDVSNFDSLSTGLRVSGYTGSSKTLILKSAPNFTVVSGDKLTILMTVPSAMTVNP